ncbi:BTAD domain-containing putative transcriptional regulator [Streptomyces sp. NPDC020192]|uniref:BTAD domain-containing putative transcriptional regulator n=1 Tax=Streptomyces sp. NPDC020192 TaxID=3365066 RepID=UPI0037BCD0EB
MRVVLLGPVSATKDDGSPIPLGGPQIRTLLALLALEAGRAVSAERLIDGIWVERPPAHAANALQTVVKRLRAALAPEKVVELRPSGYVLVVDPDRVDAHRFDRLVDEAYRASSAGDWSAAAAGLEAALGLWAGRAVAGLADVPELRAAAVRWEEGRLAAVEARADAYAALGRATELVRDLLAEVSAHPLREPLVARAMTALAAAGRRPEALALFRNTRARLAEELGIDPSDRTLQVYTEILQEPMAADSPQRTVATAVATGLPHRLTSFVGREAELAGLGSLLTTARLVTLTGPGGSGKSRLAMETAALTADRFRDGCRLVELAAVAQPELVGYAVSAALGIVDDARSNRTEADRLPRLLHALTGRAMLLIIDNCEHLLSGVAPLVAEILQRCPGIRVLATSREPLGVPGDVLYPVPGLALPEPGAGVAEASASPAVRLFIDRVRAVLPGFELEPGNCAAVSSICRRLDGLPLALELAAVRMRALSPDVLAAGLDDRFRLLTSGSRTALPRHQTLRAVVAWSWDQLTAAEREMARRFAVFARGATAEGVRHVCDGDVLATLASLVEKSLVEMADGRYRMLETIRAFADEELTAAGEGAEVRRRHLDYYAAMVEQAEPALHTAAQAEWILRLDAEHDNCTHALTWALESGDAESALRLFGSWVWYLLQRGHHAELASWRRRVLAAAPDGPPPGLTSAYLACAYAADVQEYLDPQEWAEVMDRSGTFTGLYRQALLEERPPHPLFTLITALREYEQGAVEPFSHGLSFPDPWLEAHAFLLRGGALLNEGRYDQCAADLEAAVTRFRRIGDKRGLSRALLALATALVRTDRTADAAPLIAEAAEPIPPWAGADEAVAIFAWIAHLHYWSGNSDGAAEALARARSHVSPGLPPAVLAGLQIAEADVVRLQGDPVSSIPLYEEALRVGAEAGEADDKPSAPGIYPAIAHGMVRRPANVPRPTRPRVVRSVGEAWGQLSYTFALIQVGGLAEAEAQLAITVEQLRDVWNLPLLMSAGVARAALSLAVGDAEHAATILGAVGALHSAPGRGGPDTIRVSDEVRAALGEAGFQRAALIGHSMSADEFVAALATGPRVGRGGAVSALQDDGTPIPFGGPRVKNSLAGS